MVCVKIIMLVFGDVGTTQDLFFIFSLNPFLAYVIKVSCVKALPNIRCKVAHNSLVWLCFVLGCHTMIFAKRYFSSTGNSELNSTFYSYP